MNAIAAVVLAAGGSRRHGSPKQLRRFGGVPLVRRSVDAALAAGLAPCVVVLGASAEKVRDALGDAPVDTVFNPSWETGMSSSIRAGIARLRETAPKAEAAMLLLADQARVSATVLRALSDRLSRGPEAAAACRYEGVLGPPALFRAALFDRLGELSGDEGARAILRGGGVTVAAVDFPDGAFDVDYFCSLPPG